MSNKVSKGHVWMKKAIAAERWESWKKKLLSSSKPPTTDQWEVIQRIYERCCQMRQEHNSNTQKKSLQEPLRLIIQGLPGAGKSQVIQWVRCLALMEASCAFQLLLPNHSFAYADMGY